MTIERGRPVVPTVQPSVLQPCHDPCRSAHGGGAGGIDTNRYTWLGSDRLLARLVGRPVARFLHIEAAGGILLLGATVIALVWANSPWSESYEELWTTVLTVEIGGHGISEDLRHWVNDALMAVFFFVVGLEIKRELVVGQLSTLRDAALPAVAAVGGMVVPALVYLAFNASGDGRDGWGIPMATDIAFAVGVLTLLGSRAPAALRVMLLGLAIADDIGAIVVIAVFYTDDLDARAMALAGVGLVAVVLLVRGRVWYAPVYLALGVAVWVAVFNSGVHATIAGVALGLLAPARPAHGRGRCRQDRRRAVGGHRRRRRPRCATSPFGSESRSPWPNGWRTPSIRGRAT